MRRFLSLAVLAVAFLSTATFASIPGGPCAPWEWRKPLPFGDNLTAVAYGNGRYVVGDSSGRIRTSEDLENWNLARQASDPSASWKPIGCLAWTGEWFMAGAADGKILLSPDGLRWTEYCTGISQAITGIAWNGTTYVAVGGDIWQTVNGVLLTSTDGMTWTKRLELEQGKSLTRVAWTGERFVTIGGNYTEGAIFTSTDGLTWAGVPIDASAPLMDIAGNGECLVAVGGDWSGPVVLRSTDGLQWENVPIAVSYFIQSVIWAGHTFSAFAESGLEPGGRAEVLLSIDGLNWSGSSGPWPSGVGFSFSGQAWDSQRILAVGRGGLLYSSSDGVNWTPHTTQEAADDGDLRFNGVAWGNGTFVAVGWGNEETDEGSVFTSPDGIEWTRRHLDADIYLESVIFDGHQFVAVGDYGGTFTSPDGTTWALRYYGDEELAGVAYSGSKYVAVGGRGVMKATASDDGITWHAIDMQQFFPGYNGWLWGAAWGAGRFVAVGMTPHADPLCIVSEDGETWRSVRFPSGGSTPASVLWDGSRFLAPTGNKLLISPDGLSWTASEIPGETGVGIILFAANRYWGLGNGTVMVSPDGETWSDGRTISDNWLHGIASNGSRLVAVGSYGSILTLDLGVLAVDAAANRLCGSPPLAVRFTGEAGGGTPPYTFSWDFGDGSPPSAEPNPVHLYDGPGVYGAVLTVTDGAGASVRSDPGQPITISVVEVAPPVVTAAKKKGDPFKVILTGSNFHPQAEVFLGDDAVPWAGVTHKGSTKLVLTGAKARFPKGVPVPILVKNPNCGTATTTFTR